MTPPVAAVVIATYQRADRLPDLLDALATQDFEDVWELVIVDNGSTDTTAEELTRLSLPSNCRVLRIDQNRGPARARNVGWRATTAPLVVFTDDDCRPTPGWLRRMVERADHTDADVVQGAVSPDPRELERLTPWCRTLRIDRFTNLFETANIAYRRVLLQRLDGFDEAFPVAAGEDTDLGWRARELDATVTFAPDALVHHAVWDHTFVDHLRSRRRWAETVRVVHRHPGVRAVLHRGYFYRRNHARLLGALLVAVPAALVHPGLLLMLVTGFVVVHSRRVRSRGWSWPLCVRNALETLLVTAWEVVLFARSSVRHRTLVL